VEIEMASNGNSKGGLLRAGGGLSICAGLLEIVSGVALFTGFPSFLNNMLSELSLNCMGVPLLVLGIIAIVGGISAIRRKNFGLSLAGAICALPSGLMGILNIICVPMGILAIIFVSLGKREFSADRKENGI
jgi:hypothetical protein